MGGKNIFKKPGVFSKDGFFVVLFISLCIVAVAAVYVSTGKFNSKGKDLAGNELTDPINNVDFVTEEEFFKRSVPVSFQPPKTENKNTETQKKEEKKVEKVTFKLSTPVAGNIIRDFSIEDWSCSPTTGDWETHEGIDIACEFGTDVKAAEAGKVVAILGNDDILHSDVKSGYGVVVVIEHQNGMRTYYSNLQENLPVKVGATVKKGDVIGKVGDTSIRELVEGSHLHFALVQKKDNKFEALDPKKYMDK